MKRHLHLIGSIAIVMAITSAHGQLPPPQPTDPGITKRKQLVDTLKSGGGAAAVANARANVNAAGNRNADLDVGDQLREVTYWLANERHPKAVEAAMLAIAESEKAKGRISAAEEADLHTENGRIYEAIFGDLTRAKTYYQEALRQRAGHSEAAKGLARIASVERRAAEKAQENEAMRLRRQSPGSIR